MNENHFWYATDRDAKSLAVDYSPGMFNNNLTVFEEWVNKFATKIMMFLNVFETDHSLIAKCEPRKRHQYVDFYRKSDHQFGNLHTMARVYFSSRNNNQNLQNCRDHSIKLLKEKQPLRSVLETCVVKESTIDDACSICFIRLTNNTKEEYQIFGPLDMLPSPKRYPTKGLLYLATWIIQMYTSSMGRIQISVPLNLKTFSNFPKTFLGANQNAVYYKMIDNSVVKVFHNSKLCQNELKYLQLLNNMFEVFATSSVAFQFRPLAKKVKKLNWSHVLQFLHTLFDIHDKGIVHQNISIDSMMLTKSDPQTAIFVNFEYAVMIGDENSHQYCSKQIVSDRILQMRMNGHDPYFPHFNDDLQAFVRSLIIFMEQIQLPSKNDPKTMINFWKRVFSRRTIWSNLDVAASLGNRNIMIDLINGMKFETNE